MRTPGAPARYRPRRWTTRIALPALCGLLAAALLVIAARPDLDLAAARLFFVAPHHFVADTRIGRVARYAAWSLPFATFFALCLATIGRRRGFVPARLAPSGRSLAFLAVSLALGPGLIVHSTLKELSHRPRPYDTAAFGGTKTFRPFVRFDGACPHNCAFPSGETAAATWMVAPASLVPPPWTAGAVAVALALAAATGALRMAFGAHFLSDVCAAALITLLVVAACRRLICDRMS